MFVPILDGCGTSRGKPEASVVDITCRAGRGVRERVGSFSRLDHGLERSVGSGCAFSQVIRPSRYHVVGTIQPRGSGCGLRRQGKCVLSLLNLPALLTRICWMSWPGPQPDRAWLAGVKNGKSLMVG